MLSVLSFILTRIIGHSRHPLKIGVQTTWKFSRKKTLLNSISTNLADPCQLIPIIFLFMMSTDNFWLHSEEFFLTMYFICVNWHVKPVQGD